MEQDKIKTPKVDSISIKKVSKEKKKSSNASPKSKKSGKLSKRSEEERFEAHINTLEDVMMETLKKKE